ncbi:MAG: MarR family transcriptional regulator, partial [Lachnospiraceae bacterium]|nr:MarR family transcriptional regulator [Lachnospiraceae bacterium]
CPKTRYILSPLSACIDIFNQYTLNIICPFGNSAYRFEVTISPGNESAKMKLSNPSGEKEEEGELDG